MLAAAWLALGLSLQGCDLRGVSTASTPTPPTAAQHRAGDQQRLAAGERTHRGNGRAEFDGAADGEACDGSAATGMCSVPPEGLRRLTTLLWMIG
jgi:hypothetical protein